MYSKWNEMSIWIYLILVAGATDCTDRTCILAVDFHLVHQYNPMSIVYVIFWMYWVPLSLSRKLVSSYIGLGQDVGYIKKIFKIWSFICDKNKKVNNNGWHVLRPNPWNRWNIGDKSEIFVYISRWVKLNRSELVDKYAHIFLYIYDHFYFLNMNKIFNWNIIWKGCKHDTTQNKFILFQNLFILN